MAFSVDLLDGLARLIAGTAPEAFRYSPPGETPTGAGPCELHLDALPTTPDRAVALALYPVDTDSGHTTGTWGVQARIRGRPDSRKDVKDDGDMLATVLDNARPEEVSGIPVIRVWLQSGADLPTDENRRQHVTRNYYITLTQSTPHRRD